MKGGSRCYVGKVYDISRNPPLKKSGVTMYPYSRFWKNSWREVVEWRQRCGPVGFGRGGSFLRKIERAFDEKLFVGLPRKKSWHLN